MNRLLKTATVLLLGSSLMACSMTNEGAGTLTGAAVGGLIGSRFGNGPGQAVATAAGAFAGAVIGGSIGQEMDRADRAQIQRALEGSSDHQVVTWHNPNNHRRYEVVPTRTYYRHRASGYEQPCREYHMRAIVAGRAQQVYGKACRQADGNWKIVS